MEEPPSLDLYTRLRAALDEIASQHDFELVWQPEPDSAPECSPATAEQVINIVREALINSTRHAQAWKVNVFAGRRGEEYFVTVEDNGRGFDSSQPAPNGHFGLQIMNARTEHIGGRIEIQSALGQGTRVTLWWKA